MARGTGDRIAGAWDKLMGRTKKASGDLTDNPRQRAEGERDYLKGGGKQVRGNLKDAGKKAKDTVKGAFD